MRDKLEAIKAEALAKIESAEVVSTLNDVKVAILGKKGELTQVLKSMKDVAPEDRPKVGQMVNEARQAIETALDEKTKAINRALRAEKMKRETIDVTLPGVKKLTGHRHPNQIALEDLERVFIGMGYEIVEGPDVEYDKYNFELLNIPANHPAKDEQGYILCYKGYPPSYTDITCSGKNHGEGQSSDQNPLTWTSIQS